MGLKQLDKNKPKVGIVTSQAIIIVFLLVDVYVLFTKESIVAKSLASASFVVFMFLLLPSLKWTFKSRN